MTLNELLETQTVHYCDEREIQRMINEKLSKDFVTSLCWVDDHPAIEINGVEQWFLVIYVENGECILNSDYAVTFICLDKSFWHRLLLEIDQ